MTKDYLFFGATSGHRWRRRRATELVAGLTDRGYRLFDAIRPCG